MEETLRDCDETNKDHWGNTCPGTEFPFDFELSLTYKFKDIWDQFPCIRPLDLCQWRETDFGSLEIANEEI